MTNVWISDPTIGGNVAVLAVHRSRIEIGDLGRNAMDERDRLNEGMNVRRAVHGDAYVEGSVKRRTAFNGEFLDMLTRYAWGEIWTRPGLDRCTRSLLCLAMLVALNREDEFRLHVRSALNNGVTREQIKEVLLQTAVYCGMPAANSAFHVAAEIFAEIDQQPVSQGA
jgi:4-carboxymuconolactone decarboxylase